MWRWGRKSNLKEQISKLNREKIILTGYQKNIEPFLKIHYFLY